MKYDDKHSSLPYWLVIIPLLVLVFAGYWALVERAQQLRHLAQKERAARLATLSVHLERELTDELSQLFASVSRSEDLDEIDLPSWALAVFVYDQSGLLFPKSDFGSLTPYSYSELNQWHLQGERFEQVEGNLKQALHSFQQAALAARSKESRALALIGTIRCFRKMGEFDSAIKEANRLVDLYGNLESPLGVSYRLLAQELVVNILLDRAGSSFIAFNKAGLSLLRLARDMALNSHRLPKATLESYDKQLQELGKKLKKKATKEKASQEELFARLSFWLSQEAKQLKIAPWQKFAHQHSLRAIMDKAYLVAERYGRQSIVVFIDGKQMAKRLNKAIGDDEYLVKVQLKGSHLLSLSGLVIEGPRVEKEENELTPRLGILALLAILAIIGIFVLRSRTSQAIEIARERSAFLARFSHELKTPLTSMRLLTEGMVNGKSAESDKREKHLRLVAQEAARLEGLLQNVFLYSRHSEDKIIPAQGAREHDLDELLEESLSLFIALHGSERFRYEPSCEPLTIAVDSDGIKRAIINLVDNALRYSPADQAIDIITKKQESTCLLTIRDYGAGISTEDEEKIFTAFFSREKPTKGLGLGLHICTQIITRNGGTVRYQKPADGPGALFIIELPHRKEWGEQ